MTEQCYYAVSDSLNLNSMEFVHVLLWLCLLFVYAASSGCRNAHTAAAAAAVAGSATVGAGSAAGLVFWLEANSRIVKIHGSSFLGLFQVGCCCIAWPNAKMHNVHTKCSSSFSTVLPNRCGFIFVFFNGSEKGGEICQRLSTTPPKLLHQQHVHIYRKGQAILDRWTNRYTHR